MDAIICCIMFTCCFYSLFFFVAAYLRMNKIIARMPILKKTEKYFIWAIMFLSLTVLTAFGALVLTILYLLNKSDVSHDKKEQEMIVNSVFAVDFIQLISSFLFQSLLLWIGMLLTYNTEERSSNHSSLLMFVKSKYDMRKVFYPDEVKQSTPDVE
jgi:hypothetical protein